MAAKSKPAAPPAPTPAARVPAPAVPEHMAALKRAFVSHLECRAQTERLQRAVGYGEGGIQARISEAEQAVQDAD